MMFEKDFSTNVLIPAIVWLVCSVLITVGIMSQIEDGRFFAPLFVVICGAIFAVPMIIYLNFRTIINDYFDGKKRKQVKGREVPEHSTEVACPIEEAEDKPIAEEDYGTAPTSTDWPSLFTDSKAIVLFDGLVKENLLAEGYKKKEGTEATQLAYTLGTIYEILNINPRWKEFELFWNVKNLRQTFNQTFSRGTVVKNQYAIKLAIQKAADSDTAIKNMDKYIKWRKENAVD